MRSRILQVRWSIILTVSENLSRTVRCLDRLIPTLSPRAEVFLILPNKALPEEIITYKSLGAYYAQSKVAITAVHDLVDESTGLPRTAVDQAIEASKGELLLFMTGDLLVANNFLQQITYCLENFSRQFPLGEVGCVMPICNAGAGRQLLELPPELNPMSVDEVQFGIQQRLQADPGRMRWIVASIASDFCMLIPREVYLEVGPFDYTIASEIQRGTEWLTRLTEHNLLSVLSGEVYVYRDNVPPSQAATQISLPNEVETDEKRLAILYRICLQTEQQRAWFLHSLERSAQLTDLIFVLDNGSKIKLASYAKEHAPATWSKVARYEKIFAPRDDKHDFNRLIALAEEANADWIIGLETSEVIEKRITKEHLQRLMHPPDKRILGYAFNEFYMWGDNGEWRADDIWSKINTIKMAKLLPQKRILGVDVIANKAGYVPALPAENVRHTGIRLQCYALQDEAHRVLERKTLEQADSKSNWSYITDVRGLQCYPWQHDRSISVYAPMYKDDNTYQWLDHIWAWADEIIVGNDRNQLNDDVLKTLDHWGATVVPCSMSNDYSEGRNQILKYCTSSHVLQLDVDEEVQMVYPLFRMVMLPANCWMFSIDNLQQQGSPVVSETIRLFTNTGLVKYWGRLHETIDDYVKSTKCIVSSSPVKLTHYGYLRNDSAASWKKMQRYIGINMEQMKESPDDGRAYYHLAVHMLEDQLYEDALRLLNLAVMLSNGQVLPTVELAKLLLTKSYVLFKQLGSPSTPKQGSLDARNYSKEMFEFLEPALPVLHPSAKGHCKAYFTNNVEQRKWLLNHLLKMESKVFLQSAED